MKNVAGFGGLIGLSLTLAVAQEPARPAGGAAIERVKQLVRADHAYNPAVREEANVTIASSPEIVVMDTVTVTESIAQRYLESAVERDRSRREQETFSFVRGGALLRTDIGKTRLEVGTWGTGSGLNLLKLSW